MQTNDNTRVLLGPFDQILTLAQLPKAGPISDQALEIVKAGGITIQNGRVVEVGSFDRLRTTSQITIQEVVGPLVALPGFIDAHTHICFAGSRAQDYASRLNGKSYQEIAQNGGGILDTVQQTRLASEERLVAIMLRRLDRLMAGGISTCEVKSGYGLNLLDELKMLNAIAAASRLQPITLVSTCLAAHVKPIEFNSPSEYLQFLVKTLLPLVKQGHLASRVDIFVEPDTFKMEESRRYLLAAKSLGFALCVHADQFSRGGAQLAAEVSALSADHLEQSTAEDFKQLVLKNVAATVLPGSSLGLGMPFAPVRSMLDHGLSLVIASDWNPGSAPMGDLLTLAALLGMNQRLTNAETFAGMTFRAAQALKLGDRGVLAPGLRADIVAFPCADYREILYNQGALRPSALWIRGQHFNLAPEI